VVVLRKLKKIMLIFNHVYSYKNTINIALILAVNDVIDVGVE
jgi:hypothetical protein